MTDRVLAVELLRAGGGPARLVEGWVEGPCAEAADLRGINTLMLDFFDDPGFVADLFDFTTRLAISFARAQVDAGVDIVGVGDAAASLVGPDIYEEVVWPYEKRLVDAIHEMGSRVRLHICGNMSRSVGPMARLGAEIIDLDSLVPLDVARAAAGTDQVLLGNLNPVTELLGATPDEIGRLLAERHRQAGSRYIVGAGCEIPAATPHANVDALVAFARGTRP
jgi:MtaA/CmuA family methyltransferase